MSSGSILKLKPLKVSINSIYFNFVSPCPYGSHRYSTSSVFLHKRISKRILAQSKDYSDNILASSYSFLSNSTIRKFSSEWKPEEDTPNKTVISDEYVPFQDRKQIIQDVIEQQWNPLPERIEEPVVSFPVNLERGKTGVFDLEELVELLKSENAEDLCVIELPKEINYVDHMVIVTARSPKHMLALGTFVRKRYKMKDRKSSDIIPKLEGQKSSKDWIALDLGNIALHIFCFEAREIYDLETLWTVGAQFDDLVNEKDSEIVQLLNLTFPNEYMKAH